MHIALKVSGVKEEPRSQQSLSFVATSNAISYCGARPVFVDINKDKLSICSNSLEEFFHNNTVIDKKEMYNKITKNIISACLPMHLWISCRH